ncbi:MAG: hydroxypyruvate isomerase family protein [Oceanospirillaceae bacterium]|nr:hydroxypyruvate isomerase family protein [Oceanospirillaceae bacterium]
MNKFAANLSMLFTELDFLDRFEAAAAAGFTAVEYLFPYDYSAEDLQAQLRKYHLTQALFNAPPGDWQNGERGIACLQGREQEFIAGIEQAIEYAKVLGNKRIHVMAGIIPDDSSTAATEQRYINNLRLAAQLAKAEQITILIEPINNTDMPGYLLNYPQQAIEFIDKIDCANLRLQFDFYHCQIMQGNVIETFKRLQTYIDHVQIAGVPGRHEPDQGELNYHYILQQIAQSSYAGYIGCEYLPRTTTLKGLGWLKTLNKTL